MKCLQEAHKNKFRSISLPTIGSGGFNFPKRVISETIMKVIKLFCIQNPQTTLVDIRIIVYGSDGQLLEVNIFGTI